MNDPLIRAMAERLAHAYAFPGASGHPLEAVLEACTWRHCPAGETLCEEDDKGNTLFLLMAGSVDVYKRDARGSRQKLATVQAPSLLGHMSLIDRSPRSATCVTASECQVGVMEMATFDELRAARTESGTAFRRLLLASLNQQLRRGDARLHALLNEAEPAVEKAQAQLQQTVGALEGWETTTTPGGSGADWKATVFASARALPLGPGARLRVDTEGAVPFVLEFEGLSPDQTDPIVRRWIRFVHSIPTPPAMEIRYHNCPSDIFPRPKALERRLRVFYPVWSTTISGDEQVVTVAFSNVDGRW